MRGRCSVNNNPIVFQGPHETSSEELEFCHGTIEVASAHRAYESITTAIADSSLLPKTNEVRTPSLAMAEVRRMYVPSDNLDKQAYLR